jgi:hypothetical protein
MIAKPRATSGGVHDANRRRADCSAAISAAQTPHNSMCASIAARSPGSHSSYR